MKFRRLSSLDVKLPLLMAAIVIVTTTAVGALAYSRFESVLYEVHGERMRSSAQLLAQALGDGIPAARAQLSTMTQAASVRRILEADGSRGALADSAALTQALPRTLDSTRIRFRVLDRAGVTRAEIRPQGRSQFASWADTASQRGALSAVTLTVSPFLVAGDQVQYEVAMPIHARDDGESLVGYLVETRVVRGRGVDAVRRLTGSGTLLVGAPDGGVWSDLDGVVPGPPPIAARDSVLIFDASARGPGVGVAQAIRGTPWVVWLESSRAQVLAPIDDFLRVMVPLALVVAAVGTFVAWATGRRLSSRITGLAALMEARGRNASSDATPTELGAVDSRASASTPERRPDGERISPATPPLARDELDDLEEAFRYMAEQSDRHDQLEAQVMQSQKLEAVGRLAGGIAHDFNNMLTVVSNYGEMVAAQLPPESEGARDMEEVLHATERAARLTRQLLAFSRRQVLQPVVLDLNEVVRGAHRMLERLLPSNVRIEEHLDASVSPVIADPGQIEQVLLNLALNAADAMPKGGSLGFTTTMTELDDPPAPTNGGAQPKQFVQLTVRDTGHGMDRATAARVFEPFFTTKAPGKGTGLGLASVHGIVTQLGGRVWLYSEVGIGTTFKIFLPAGDGPAESVARERAKSAQRRGSGTILLVEDDAATREVTRRLLVAHGFAVDAVESGSAALSYLTANPAKPRLVLSDVMMPGMTGVDLGAEIGDRYPSLPVLLMSGYADSQVQSPRVGAVRRPLIEKPFTSSALLDALWRAIDAAPTPSAR